MESGSTVSSSLGPSPNLQLISHFGSSADDAPVKKKKKMEILISLLIANRHVDMVKLLVLSCVINCYVNAFTISKANCECKIVRKPCQRWTGAMWRKRLDRLWLTERIKLLCHWNTWFLFNNSSNPFKTLRFNFSLNLSVFLDHGLLWTTFAEPPPLCFRISHFFILV